MSDVCELFGGYPGPGGAEQQDYRLVIAISDYRAAREAVRLFNEGRKGMEHLNANQPLLDLLVELARIQTGVEGIEARHLMMQMHANAPETEDEDA